MPLYEIDSGSGSFKPFRKIVAGPELYEREIEGLLWNQLEEFTGEQLFRIARQPMLPHGGRPDVIALDESGRVVVVEIKRDVDRDQLAQALEYAGWARGTNLDQLSGLYHLGQDRFFEDWQTFTSSGTPVIINPAARLMLVARDFDVRTRAAFDFLISNGMPVKWLPVTIYEGEDARRLVDIEADHEPEFASARSETGERVLGYQLGRRVKVADLLEAGLIRDGEALVWKRRNLGHEHTAHIDPDGSMVLEDGQRFAAPSTAAMTASRTDASIDGWQAWKVERLDVTLDELRREFLESVQDGPVEPSDVAASTPTESLSAT